MQSEEFLAGYDHYPMNRQMRENIAWLATARMNYTFNANNNVMAFVDSLRMEAAMQTPEGGFFLGPGVLNSPFGTRVGEISVYRRLRQYRNKIYSTGLA
jgi:hypothetical protein